MLGGLPVGIMVAELLGFAVVGIVFNLLLVKAARTTFWEWNDIIHKGPLWSCAVALLFQAVIFPVLLYVSIGLFYEGDMHDYYLNSKKRWQEYDRGGSDFSSAALSDKERDKACWTRINLLVLTMYLAKDIPWCPMLVAAHHVAGILWVLVFLWQMDGANGYVLICFITEFVNLWYNLHPLVLSWQASNRGWTGDAGKMHGMNAGISPAQEAPAASARVLGTPASACDKQTGEERFRRDWWRQIGPPKFSDIAGAKSPRRAQTAVRNKEINFSDISGAESPSRTPASGRDNGDHITDLEKANKFSGINGAQSQMQEALVKEYGPLASMDADLKLLRYRFALATLVAYTLANIPALFVCITLTIDTADPSEVAMKVCFVICTLVVLYFRQTVVLAEFKLAKAFV